MLPLLRWMRRRAKKICTLCCCLIVVLVVMFGMFAGYMNHTNHCSENDSKQLISDLCELYKKGEVDGSFCHGLCDTNTFHYEKCGNYKRGKKVIFMTCDNCVAENQRTNIVMKMKSDLKDRDRFDLFRVDAFTSIAEYVKECEKIVRSSFDSLNYMKFIGQRDIVSWAWNWDLKEYMVYRTNKTNSVHVAMDNVWSLIQQPEYIMYRALQRFSYIPRIYGTCGPAYFVENTPTLSKYEFEFFRKWSPSDWKERAKVAINLIELMYNLRHRYSEIHLCDVKFDNFGIRDNGEVTLLDTDCAMFHKSLLIQFEYSNCSKHDDCDFFDCRSYCNVTTNKCLIERTNNNMQAVCEDVFIGYFSKLPTGLLRDPPNNIKVQLFHLLQECAYPGTTTTRHTARAQASEQTAKELSELLSDSIKED